MLLSVIIPVYNEVDTIGKVLEKVKATSVPKEIIIVDDGSTDGSRELLEELKDSDVKVIYHNRNRGKGAAIRTALNYVEGDYVLIQDADLEYDPEEYPKLIAPILQENPAVVVFGSRFLGHVENMKFRYYIANRLLTFIANILYGSSITDLCTGFKLYKTSLIRSIPLERNGFDLEHELTAKLLRRRLPIVEVPISYRGRDVRSGKKVRLRDFFLDIYTLVRYRLCPGKKRSWF